MKTIIYIGPKKLSLPHLRDLPDADIEDADIVIVTNRLVTKAKVLKNRHGTDEDAFVVYMPEE